MGYDRAGVRGDGCEKRLLITRRGMTAIGRRHESLRGSYAHQLSPVSNRAISCSSRPDVVGWPDDV